MIHYHKLGINICKTVQMLGILDGGKILERRLAKMKERFFFSKLKHLVFTGRPVGVEF